MNKLAKTLVLFPAVMLLSACNLSDLGIPQKYSSFKSAVEKIKDHEYAKATAKGYSSTSDDLNEVYNWESNEWVADAENTTDELGKYIIKVQELIKEIDKTYSDSKIDSNFKFYVGINVYKIEFTENEGIDSISFTYKYNQYGYPTYLNRKVSIKGSVTSAVECNFSYE